MFAYIKIKNFKTYKDEVIVGPFRPLTLVIGRNGSGKSNFADAIAFAMGIKLDLLRADTLANLIHGENVNKRASNRASVTVGFNLEDGMQKEFTRVIVLQKDLSARSLYQVDNQETNEKRYLEEMKKLGVCMDLGNYYISQGNVEAFVTMKPNNFTSLVEEISSSAALKPKYNEINKEVSKDSKCVFELTRQQRNLIIEAKGKKDELSIYENYRGLLDDLDKLECNQKLLLLYHNEREVEQLEEKKNELNTTITALINRKEHTQSEFRKMDTKKLHKKLSQMKIELYNMRKEYDQLKQEAEIQTVMLRQQLNAIKREQKSIQENINREQCEKVKIGHQQARIQKEIDNNNTSLQKLGSIIKEKEKCLDEKKKKIDEMKTKCSRADEERKKMKHELEKIENHLQQMDLGKNFFLQQQKKQEVVNKLKDMFGKDILGRLSELCEPVHERYKLAITKVMAKNMNTIVVKTKRVALEAIEYLISLELPPENFLPLDNIKVPQIQQRLRDIGRVHHVNVKLLYDVVKYKNHIVEPAVRFAIRNCLVCENTDDARFVAYEMSSEKHNVVALEGTYYKKEGSLSAGKQTLEDYAKNWMAKDFLQLQNKKEKLQEKLRDLQADSNSLHNLRSDELSSLEVHITSAKEEKEKMTRNIEKLQPQLEQFNLKTASINSAITVLEQNLEEYNSKAQQIENEIKIIEDAIFSDFCNKISVANISEYEKGTDYRAYKEREERKTELLKLKKNILIQLKYEREKLASRTSNVRNEKELKNLKVDLEKAKNEVDTAAKDKENEKHNITEFRLRLHKQETELFSTEKQVATAKEEIENISGEIIEGKSQMENIDMKLQNLRCRYHDLLLQCKVQGMIIPMSHGTMQDIEESESGLNDSTSSSQYERQDRRRFIIDYSQLPERLKRASNVDEKVKELNIKIEDTLFLMRNMNPNKKVVNEFNKIKSAVAKVQLDLKSAVKSLHNNRQKLKSLKEERSDKFMRCFSFLETEVDEVYKEMYSAQNGEAILSLENTEEPYLGGVRYSVQVPGKKCVAMDCLSCGEAAMASLAFIFALNRYRKAPIIVLDEPDGGLDRENVSRLAKFLKKDDNLQVIAIVHYNRYSYAKVTDDLMGVSSKTEDGVSVSKLYILDLTQYRK